VGAGATVVTFGLARSVLGGWTKPGAVSFGGVDWAHAARKNDTNRTAGDMLGRKE
jgi:hypothetical protein